MGSEGASNYNYPIYKSLPNTKYYLTSIETTGYSMLNAFTLNLNGGYFSISVISFYFFKVLFFIVLFQY